MLKKVMLCVVSLSLVCVYSGNVFALGDKPLETEKVAVNFSREVERGGYKIVTAEELRNWIDLKKDMLIVDTMPYEASFVKNHVPGAVQFEFPKEEVTALDQTKKADLEKLLGPLMGCVNFAHP